MVIREWRGRADPERSDDYPIHFQTQVVPALREVRGFAGATLGR